MTTFEILKTEYPGVLNDIDEFMSANWNLANTSVEEEVNKLSPEDVIDLYLRWNGICGWSSTVVKLIKTLYHVEDKEEKNNTSDIIKNIASAISGKKAYRIALSAEGEIAGLVDLTDSEYEVAKKILNPENWRDKYEESYSPDIFFTEVTDDVLIAHYKSLAKENGDL